MPIKKDGSGKRWVEMELLLPGTPEQVWHAIATGPGYAAWFTESDIEPVVGGALRFHFAEGMTTHGQVTAWEPPHRFGYVEREWSQGAPPVATEITITARSGDVCVMRMVHSLFSTSDDWDDEVEGFERGWPGFFAVLRCYLAHFAGAPAATFTMMSGAPAPARDVWRRLVDALALANASVGEHRASSSGPEPWSGIVEHVHQDGRQRYVVLRTDAPAPGIVMVGTDDKGASAPEGGGAGTCVSVCRYYYGDDARARASEGASRWRAWLASTFASEAP